MPPRPYKPELAGLAAESSTPDGGPATTWGKSDADDWGEPLAVVAPERPGENRVHLDIHGNRGTSLFEWLDDRAVGLGRQYVTKAAGGKVELNVPTGIARLDAAGLLEPDILSAVAAHAGDGKSAFALQLLEGAARAGHHGIGFFLEDPARLVADRELARSLGVSAFSLRRLGVESGSIEERLKAAVRGAGWARNVTVSDSLVSTDVLFDQIERWRTPKTRIVVVDYAQAFDAEHNEKSVERVVARLSWRANELAKKYNLAFVLMSQVRREVLDRGRRWYENWRWKNQGGELTPEAVEGFRPLTGDLQWSSAIGQRAKQILSLFRPGNWMRSLGADCKDDTIEVSIVKGNFGPSNELIRLGWDGPQARIFDPRGK